MAKNFGRVNVSITASTGGLTAGLNDASRQLRGFNARTQGLSGTLTSAIAGFVGLGQGASAASIAVRALGLSIKAMLGPLLIVTTLVEFFSRIGSAASDLDSAGKAAQRLGMSTATLQSLTGAANEAGLSVEHATALFTTMTRNLGQLANGNASAQRSFAAVGLTLQDLQNLSPEAQFELIAQRIMALPTAAQRTAAAMAVFGRQGAAAMGFLGEAANGAVSAMRGLQDQLGVNITQEQTRGIQLMNDAISRTSLVFQGFINQFVAGLAPAMATVANLFVRFFMENQTGFSMSQALADGLTAALRNMAAAVQVIYGAFELMSGVVGLFGSGALAAFEGVTWAIERMLDAMASVAEQLPGVDVGLAESLRSAQQYVSALSSSAGQEAAVWGEAAAMKFEDGVRHMQDPYAAFDAEFESVQQQMREAGAVAGQEMALPIKAQIQASTQALKAILVGTTEGEAFRNSLIRGSDPRLEGDAQKQTADNTATMVDQLDELNNNLSMNGIGMATIGV